MAAPIFFHISPEWCGDARLVRLFRRNGHCAAMGENGDLAARILLAEAEGRVPFSGRDDIRLFAGLWRNDPFWQPPLEAWRRFAFLARTVPQAHFILTTRALDGWLLDRLTRDRGAVARCHAYHRGIPEADLPDLWRAEWNAHLAAVQDFFGDDPRLIRVDLDRESPHDLIDRLRPLISMPHKPVPLHWIAPPRAMRDDDLLAALDRVRAPAAIDPDYVRDVAGFCLRGRAPGKGAVAGLSGYACLWDGGARVLDPAGAPRRIRVAGSVAVSQPGRHFKLLRAEAVINDALRLGRRSPLSIDMEDSRWLGSDDGAVPGRPVLGHCRREGARNMVLWPLPGQHDVGLPGFDPAAPADPIAFEDKEDRLVWRGMISGSEMRDTVRPGPASHVFLRQLAAAQDDADARQEAFGGLCRTSRMAFVRRFWDHPDFDLGVVMAWGYREFAADPLIAPYCVPRRKPGFFRRFRYQLCLTGYDHGSNFIPMIDSRSVLLKEEDGWEVFYSGRFKPWKHYIPVARYCADIEEKLAWARDNPRECKAMSAAARTECARLRDLPTRRAIMAAILDGLGEAR